MQRSDVSVAGVGTMLPGPPIDNPALLRAFRLPPVWEEWIATFVGTRSRHFGVDLSTGRIRHSLADMGAAAAGLALTEAGMSAADVELMIMSTATPDMLMPATVNMIADRLGIDGIPTYQLQSGCTGAVQALDLAVRLLDAGQHQTALVIGAETCAKHLDLTMDLAAMSTNVQINAMLFGDGAGAAVLTTRPVPGAPLVLAAFTRLAGLGRPPGQTVEWFGQADRTATREAVAEDFKAVEESAPVMAADALHELLCLTDWKPAEVDYLLPPQLSAKMTERVVECLAVPGAEVISSVTEIGNTANAIPFFQIARALPELAPGARVAGVSVEASKWIKAAYALEMPEVVALWRRVPR